MSRKKTTEEFIKDAIEIHGNKYDYSLVVYNGSNAKVKIICPEHGIFEQRATCHIHNKSGCSPCGNKRIGSLLRKTTEEFIKDAIEIHGNKYDYSLVVYKGHTLKVKIICPEHGMFEQRPTTHIYYRCGCSRCGIKKSSKSKSYTQKTFILKAQKVHNNKYDYSLVNYIDRKTHIEIICNVHGIFKQTPERHLKPADCPKCSYEKKSTGTLSFILKSQKVHDNKYDYSLVDYKRSHDNIKIICEVHGVFEQSGFNHLKGHGCKYCSSEKTRLTTEQFIIQAKLIHGENTYDYSKTEYQKTTEKVIIICRLHGEFLQTPNSHLGQRGSGCPTCADDNRVGMYRLSLFENDPVLAQTPGYRYFLLCKDDYEIFLAIGITKNFKQRRGVYSRLYNVVDLHINETTLEEAFIEEQWAIDTYHNKYGYIPLKYFGGGRRECFNINLYQHLYNRPFVLENYFPNSSTPNIVPLIQPGLESAEHFKNTLQNVQLSAV